MFGIVDNNFVGLQPIHAKDDINARVSKEYQGGEKDMVSNLNLVTMAYL
jgi:hypothetical protein